MTSPKTINLSIIVPAYQEAPIIAETLRKLAAWLDEHDYGQVEVIVVCADSTDKTAELARAEAGRFKDFQLVEPGPRVGKGRDVRAGVMRARGHYRLFMDADLATPLHHLDTIAALMTEEVDLAIAVRDLARIHPGLKRRLVSEIGNGLIRVALLPGIKDTQCGFKLFRDDVAEAVFSRMTITGWGFDFEILAVARALGYKIKTFSVSDWVDPKATSNGLGSDSVIGAAEQTFKDLIRVRLNLWRGVYRSPAK
jgi:dolichyl-phosphate beta-glucosyltransferase